MSSKVNLIRAQNIYFNFLHREKISCRTFDFELTSGRFSNRDKMNLFVGSEPRNFISFHLDKEQTGQPLQEAEQAPEQNASDANATVPENTSTKLTLLEQDTASLGKNPNPPIGLIEEPMETQAYEQVANSSTGDSNTSFGTAIENLVTDHQSNEPDANAPAQEASVAIANPQDAESHDLPKLPPNNEILLQDSSSSQESCQTYFTRRMEELEAGDSTIPIPEVTVLPEKESFGGDLVLTPGTNQPSFGVTGTSSQSPVHFLDPDHNFSEVPHKPRDPIRAKKPRQLLTPLVYVNALPAEVQKLKILPCWMMTSSW